MPTPEIAFKAEHSTDVFALLNHLKDDVFKSKNIDALAEDSSPERIAYEWLMYLGGAWMESEYIRKGKKSRTAKRRYDSIAKLKKALGNYPSASDVAAMFTSYQLGSSEVLPIVQQDIQAFQTSDFHAKHELRALVQETNQFLKDLKAKGSGL